MEGGSGGQEPPRPASQLVEHHGAGTVPLRGYGVSEEPRFFQSSLCPGAEGGPGNSSSESQTKARVPAA